MNANNKELNKELSMYTKKMNRVTNVSYDDRGIYFVLGKVFKIKTGHNNGKNPYMQVSVSLNRSATKQQKESCVNVIRGLSKSWRANILHDRIAFNHELSSSGSKQSSMLEIAEKMEAALESLLSIIDRPIIKEVSEVSEGAGATDTKELSSELTQISNAAEKDIPEKNINETPTKKEAEKKANVIHTTELPKNLHEFKNEILRSVGNISFMDALKSNINEDAQEAKGEEISTEVPVGEGEDILAETTVETLQYRSESAQSHIDDIGKRIKENKEESMRLSSALAAAKKKKSELLAAQEEYATSKAAFEKSKEELKTSQLELEKERALLQEEIVDLEKRRAEIKSLNDALTEREVHVAGVEANAESILKASSSLSERERDLAQREQLIEELAKKKETEVKALAEQLYGSAEKREAELSSVQAKIKEVESEKAKVEFAKAKELKKVTDELEAAKKMIEAAKEEAQQSLADLEAKLNQRAAEQMNEGVSIEKLKEELTNNGFTYDVSGTIITLKSFDTLKVTIDAERHYIRAIKPLTKPVKKYRKELESAAKNTKQLIVASGQKEIVCSSSFGNIVKELVELKAVLAPFS